MTRTLGSQFLKAGYRLAGRDRERELERAQIMLRQMRPVAGLCNSLPVQLQLQRLRPRAFSFQGGEQTDNERERERVCEGDIQTERGSVRNVEATAANGGASQQPSSTPSTPVAATLDGQF